MIPWSWDHHGPVNLRVKRTGANPDQKKNTKLLRITWIGQESGPHGPLLRHIWPVATQLKTITHSFFPRQKHKNVGCGCEYVQFPKGICFFCSYIMYWLELKCYPFSAKIETFDSSPSLCGLNYGPAARCWPGTRGNTLWSLPRSVKRSLWGFSAFVRLCPHIIIGTAHVVWKISGL